MRFWQHDSQLMRLLNRLTDLVWLNVLTGVFLVPLVVLFFVVTGVVAVSVPSVLLSLPVFLGGPALCAMYDCMRRMVREEEGYLTRSFFAAFRNNLKQGIVLWMLFLAAFGALLADYFLLGARTGTLYRVSAAFALGGAVLLYAVLMYVFPLQARFVNPVASTLKNALILALSALPRTVLMMLASAVPVVLFAVAGFRVFLMILLFGVSVPGYVVTLLFYPLCLKLEDREGDQTP